MPLYGCVCVRSCAHVIVVYSTHTYVVYVCTCVCVTAHAQLYMYGDQASPLCVFHCCSSIYFLRQGTWSMLIGLVGCPVILEDPLSSPSQFWDHRQTTTPTHTWVLGIEFGFWCLGSTSLVMLTFQSWKCLPWRTRSLRDTDGLWISTVRSKHRTWHLIRRTVDICRMNDFEQKLLNVTSGNSQLRALFPNLLGHRGNLRHHLT